MENKSKKSSNKQLLLAIIGILILISVIICVIVCSLDYTKKNKKSFALVQNITTISKTRIKKPVNHYDPIKKLIADSLILDLIDNKIIELFTNNRK